MKVVVKKVHVSYTEKCCDVCHIVVFVNCIPHSAESMNRRGKHGQDSSGITEVIRVVDKNSRNECARAEAYGIPLLTVSLYFKICGSPEQLTLQ
jgi:hypothetical protein